MKYILILLLSLNFGCDIQGAIDGASHRCEDEIAKIIESIEDSCITKDELLDIIDSIRIQNDRSIDYDVHDDSKDSLDEVG